MKRGRCANCGRVRPRKRLTACFSGRVTWWRCSDNALCVSQKQWKPGRYAKGRGNPQP